MAHKGGFEALNRTLKDIRRNNSLMGGVTVLLVGDFRQTLPVIPRGTRADEVNEVKPCLKALYLWPHIQKVALYKNMRVHVKGDTSAEIFAEMLLKIGDGNFPLLEGDLTIPSNLFTVVSSLSELTSRIYPDIVNIKMKPIEWLCERAIETPKNDNAAEINEIILKAFNEKAVEYKSFDSVIQSDDAVHYQHLSLEQTATTTRLIRVPISLLVSVESCLMNLLESKFFGSFPIISGSVFVI